MNLSPDISAADSSCQESWSTWQEPAYSSQWVPEQNPWAIPGPTGMPTQCQVSTLVSLMSHSSLQAQPAAGAVSGSSWWSQKLGRQSCLVLCWSSQGSLHGCLTVHWDCAPRTTPELQPTASWWEINACRGVHMVRFYSSSSSVPFQTHSTATCLLTRRQSWPKSIFRTRTFKDVLYKRIEEFAEELRSSPKFSAGLNSSRFLLVKLMGSNFLFPPTLHSS